MDKQKKDISGQRRDSEPEPKSKHQHLDNRAKLAMRNKALLENKPTGTRSPRAGALSQMPEFKQKMLNEMMQRKGTQKRLRGAADLQAKKSQNAAFSEVVNGTNSLPEKAYAEEALKLYNYQKKDSTAYAKLMEALEMSDKLREDREGKFTPFIKAKMMSNVCLTIIEAAKSLKREKYNDFLLDGLVTVAQNLLQTYQSTMGIVPLLGEQNTKATAKGQLNEVSKYAFSEDGTKRYFKPESNADAAYRERRGGDYSEDTEMKLMDYLGIDYGEEPEEPEGKKGDKGKKGEKSVDRHLRDREIAYPMLCEFLGVERIVGKAREAQDEKGRKGALLDEAKGKNSYEYNWKYQSPEKPRKDLIMSSVKENGDAKKKGKETELTTYSERVKDAQQKFQEKTSHLPRAEDDAPVIDYADPKFHRDMSVMNTVDVLTGHVDRHWGNFKIEADKNGFKALKAIDNDMSFGKNANFGQRHNNSPGLSEGMLLDAALVKRIQETTRQDLEYLFKGMFSDNPEESKAVIAALWERFEEFKKFVENHKENIVEEWNTGHAKQELEKAVGALPNQQFKGTKSYNSLYQRQWLEITIKDNKFGDNCYSEPQNY